MEARLVLTGLALLLTLALKLGHIVDVEPPHECAVCRVDVRLEPCVVSRCDINVAPEEVVDEGE